MRNLITFIFRYSTWIIFIIYVIFSCILLFNNNPYQHHIYLTSANKLSSSIYNGTSNITSYFHLKDINEDLHQQNAQLELEVISLRKELQKYHDIIYNDTMIATPALSQYKFIIAHVIDNSIYRVHNYITIDKGSNSGIKPEMGVVDQNGVVGIVNIVGENTARIISILNPDLRLSCKLKGSNNFGSLVWDGKKSNEAILEELPRHAEANIGDTIITSGYSAVFPEGIPVGIVVARANENDDNFFALRIKLLTDFSKLGTVRIIENIMKEEISSIEESSKNAN